MSTMKAAIYTGSLNRLKGSPRGGIRVKGEILMSTPTQIEQISIRDMSGSTPSKPESAAVTSTAILVTGINHIPTPPVTKPAAPSSNWVKVSRDFNRVIKSPSNFFHTVDAASTAERAITITVWNASGFHTMPTGGSRSIQMPILQDSLSCPKA